MAAVSFLLLGWSQGLSRQWLEGNPDAGVDSIIRLLPDMLGVARIALPVFFLVLAVITLARIDVRRGTGAAFRVGEPAPLDGADAPQPVRPPAAPDDTEVLGVNYGLLRCMEWRRFEIVCAEYLRCIDYEVLESGFGARYGVDLEVYLTGEPVLVGVARCYASRHPVDVDSLRMLHAAMRRRRVGEGMAFSVCGFTSRAERFAVSHHISLLGGEALCARIAGLEPDQRDAMIRVARSGNYTTPHCPACGIRLVLRRVVGASPGQREFWGCLNHPRCKVKMPFGEETDSSGL